MKLFKWAIIGTGQVAHQVAAALRACRQAEIHSVFSRTPEKAEVFAAFFSIPRIAPSIDTLLDDADVDIVYIATPNHTHKDICIQSMKAGKHVLCEKPLGMTADEVQEIITQQQQRPCLVMEAMWSRFMPLYRELKTLLDQQTIGNVFAYEASMGHRTPFDAASRLYDPTMGGGVLLDLGVYPLSLAQWFFGGINDISATLHQAPSNVEDDALILTRHGDVSGTINVSFRRNLRNDMVIYGNRGSIEVGAPLYRPYRLRRNLNGAHYTTPEASHSFRQRMRFNQRIYSIYDRISRFKSSILPSGWDTISYNGNGYGHQIDAFHKTLEQGKTTVDIMPLPDSLKVLQAIDTCKDAESTGISVLPI